MNTAGIILCGGESRRMGTPKALLPFNGRPMLTHMADKMLGVFETVIVVAGPGQVLPALPGAVHIARDAVAGQGPLYGLATGMGTLALFDAVFLAACDLPLLSGESIRQVVGSLGSHQVAVPFIGGRLHPLSACYRTDVLPIAQRLLVEGERSLRALLDQCDTLRLNEEQCPDRQSFLNVNTPEDYAALLRPLPGSTQNFDLTPGAPKRRPGANDCDPSGIENRGTVHLESPDPCPLSSVLCPLSSVLCPLSSASDPCPLTPDR